MALLRDGSLVVALALLALVHGRITPVQVLALVTATTTSVLLAGALPVAVVALK